MLNIYNDVSQYWFLFSTSDRMHDFLNVTITINSFTISNSIENIDIKIVYTVQCQSFTLLMRD